MFAIFPTAQPRAPGPILTQAHYSLAFRLHTGAFLQRVTVLWCLFRGGFGPSCDVDCPTPSSNLTFLGFAPSPHFSRPCRVVCHMHTYYDMFTRGNVEWEANNTTWSYQAC